MPELSRAMTGKVVSIRSFSPAPCSQPAPISQERLREGLRLMEEQRRVLEALQQFRMDIDSDIAAGAEIEAGELTFDHDLKIVRPRASRPGRVLKVSFR